MSINLSVEELLNHAPELKKAIDENNKKRDEATAKERGELIKQATEAEAKLQELDKELGDARDTLNRAREAIKPLEQQVWAAQQAYSDCQGIWKASMDLLAEKYGNSEIQNALVKLGSWKSNAQYLARMGIGPIEGNRQRLEHAIEVQKELDSLFYAHGHPNEIAQKAAEAMSLIALDDLSNA